MSKMTRVRVSAIDIYPYSMLEAIGIMRDTLFPAEKCLEPHLPV